MREKIDEEVSVVMYYSARHKMAMPHIVQWKNTQYSVGKLGYHHKVWEGNTLHHIFEFADKENALSFRLNFNTSNLHWKLEAVSDGLAS
jgi:hypothetical protein